MFSECVSAMSSFNKCMSVMNARLQSLRPFIHRQRNYLKIFSDSISGIRHSQAPAGRFGSLCRYGFFRNIAPSDEPVVSRHRRPLRVRSGFLGKGREQGIFSYAENVSRIRKGPAAFGCRDMVRSQVANPFNYHYGTQEKRTA